MQELKEQYQVLITNEKLKNEAMILYNNYSRTFKTLEDAKRAIQKQKNEYPKSENIYTIQKRLVTKWENIK